MCPLPSTSVTNELGQVINSWTYDIFGRGLTSVTGSGSAASTISVTYNDTNGSRAVTNPLGEVNTYTFTTLQNVPKVTQVSRAATSTTVAATLTFTYDSNGYMASSTDWDGNTTAYVNNSHGLPTTINEAVGSSVARTTTITYDPTFVHLPKTIVTPRRTTNFTYDAHGNLLTEVIVAGAATRSFSYTYTAVGQVLTATDPRGNVTNYAYDAKGDLASVTDALGHVTSITSYDANGRPLTIIDPNGVTTSLTYDLRGRLTSQTIGTLKTAYAYNKTGNLNRVTQPDGSYLAYSYDMADRLTGIADAVGDHIAYTLDAASNLVNEQAFDPSGMLSRTRS